MAKDFILNGKSLEASLQTTGADLVMDTWRIFDDPELKFYTDDFAVIETPINNCWAMVIVRTSMVPNDPFFNEKERELIPEYVKFLDEQYESGFNQFDVYYVGVQLHQTRVPKEEEHIFRIGGMYAGGTSPIEMVRRRDRLNYGYTADIAVELSKVSDEYFLMNNIRSNFGEILKTNRDYSTHNSNNVIVDKWSITVLHNRQRYIYPIYLNPYAISLATNPFENFKDIIGFRFANPNSKQGNKA